MAPRSPEFVVQQHQATTLHYDFRLEVDGVLRSWAVPKGPSMDPAQKRLAVEVDDHSRRWGSFEGRIGGGYGKGAVIIWDRGTFENLNAGSMAEALEAGHAKFRLEGEKLRGGWLLQRTRPAAAKPQWLLLKLADEAAEPGTDLTAARPESVLSGKTIGEI
ncbi:MAG: DNA polymerase ligase N-terminal domain-containing protein [Solirubrobacteraceae bacterium]